MERTPSVVVDMGLEPVCGLEPDDDMDPTKERLDEGRLAELCLL